MVISVCCWKVCSVARSGAFLAYGSALPVRAAPLIASLYASR
jgi:hypothetical protein